MIGDDWLEEKIAVLSHEAILERVRTAGEIYEKYLGRKPVVYGRWNDGLSPVLPQVLTGSGFVGVLHFSLQSARLPEAGSVKMRWAGMDGTIIDAIGQPPIDANAAGRFLSLGETLGESMDHDFVATLVFAHWPGMVSTAYDDLRRGARYSPVLGKFVTLEAFFKETEKGGGVSQFFPDEYEAGGLERRAEWGN